MKTTPMRTNESAAGSTWLLHRLTAALLALVLAASAALPVFAADTAPTDTIYINSVSDLLAFADKCGFDQWSKGKTVILQEDLSLEDTEWAPVASFSGAFKGNGHTISAEKARLYLFDDLGVSQRWTNKFSEVGIETVGDLVGKSEEDLLRIDGIGAKAIEELRDGLEAHDLLYILENNDDVADEEDLSQLLQMVFSPDGPDDILLGTSAAPTHHADADEELLGAPIDDKKAPANGAINEDMASLDELLNQLVDTDDAEEAKDNDEE